MFLTITVYRNNDEKMFIESDSLMDAFEKSLMYSFKYDVDIVNNYTGEVHFSKCKAKYYLSTDMRLAILNSI